jgi:hypothetical protein
MTSVVTFEDAPHSGGTGVTRESHAVCAQQMVASSIVSGGTVSGEQLSAAACLFECAAGTDTVIPRADAAMLVARPGSGGATAARSGFTAAGRLFGHMLLTDSIAAFHPALPFLKLVLRFLRAKHGAERGESGESGSDGGSDGSSDGSEEGAGGGGGGGGGGAGCGLGIGDLEQVDPEHCRNLQWVLCTDGAADLGLCFLLEVPCVRARPCIGSWRAQRRGGARVGGSGGSGARARQRKDEEQWKLQLAHRQLAEREAAGGGGGGGRLGPADDIAPFSAGNITGELAQKWVGQFGF